MVIVSCYEEKTQIVVVIMLIAMVKKDIILYLNYIFFFDNFLFGHYATLVSLPSYHFYMNTF